MSNAINTKYRSYQFNGPNDSSDYNSRVEENYRDLIVLNNKMQQVSETSNNHYVSMVKNMMGITRKLDELDSTIQSLLDNAQLNAVTFASDMHYVDVDRFDGTEYEVQDVDRLMGSNGSPGLHLPPSSAASPFKSAITFGDNGFVPDSVETRVTGVSGSAETSSAVIDGTRPEFSFGRFSGPVWERNVVVNSANQDGAIMDLYVAIPHDVSVDRFCNYIRLDPYPAYSVDVLSVEYTNTGSVTLSDSDGYEPLNVKEIHKGNQYAVGYLPPGAWQGDTILASGARFWLFEPTEMTAVKIRLRQRNYYTESSNYVYTYGANHIDIGMLKTLSEGRTIIRLTPPPGETFSMVTDIAPEIWNLPTPYHSEVFDYRLIWETSLNSGVYTTTPVPLSSRVWIEITLERASNGTVPLLSGLSFEHY